MNYLQWLNHKDTDVKTKRCFMVSGSDAMLVSRVVGEVLAGVVRSGTTDLIRLNGGSSKASELDAALKQYSTYFRVILLEDVDKIKDTSFITEWLEGLRKGDRSVVLVATAGKIRPGRKTERWIPKHKEVCYIDCTGMSQDSLCDYIRGELPGIPTGLVHLIVLRCGEVPGVVMNECNKLKMFPVLDENLIKSVVVVNSEEDAVEALLDGRIADLLAVSRAINIRQFIGSLTYRLIQLAQVVLLSGQRLHYQELAERAGIPQFQMQQRFKQAKTLTLETILRRFAALHKVDKLVHSGSEVGALEYLLALW